MASPSTLASSSKPGEGLQSNFHVDYVIDFRFATTGKAQAEAEFVKLIEALDNVGLQTEVRSGDHCAVLIFAKLASEHHLKAEVQQSRTQDWLYGVRTAAPEKSMHKSLHTEPITEAERLRIVYSLITKPVSDGGAGITPKSGSWKCVESIFPLHDHNFNQQWIKDLSSKYILHPRDLEDIKDRFGEKIAFYFAFLQSYFLFLSFPAGFGILCWLVLGQYSIIYVIGVGLANIIFVEYWKKAEIDLSVQWGVRGVSKIQRPRSDFKHEGEVQDPVTGEQIKFYPPMKRLSRQLLQVPFAFAASLILGSLIATCFAIEIFISEVYDGPFKSYLVFLPTVILTVVMPTLTTLLTGFASKLTTLENYETIDAHEAAMVQKIFVLNFITSYLPIFLTAFVYVPFAHHIVPHLDIFSLAVKPFAENEKQMAAPKEGFQINPERLKSQVIYFTVTAQIVNFMLEIIVPFVKRKVFRTVKSVQAGRAARSGGSNEDVSTKDHPEEAKFLKRVRNEAELDIYDVTTDFREMVVQFGYLSLFSSIWSLTGLSFLINNWIELRGDAIKIALETQRPVPWRADSIGPWIDCLGFLAWLGSLTTAALVYLFRDDRIGMGGISADIQGWGLLLAMFAAEHVYLLLQFVVRYGLQHVDSPGLQRERRERFIVRKRYVSEKLASPTSASEKLSHRRLSEDSDLTAASPENRFWERQKTVGECVAAGRSMIDQTAPTESKKEL